jgi:tetratricopeptide (TPR) repeat protein
MKAKFLIAAIVLLALILLSFPVRDLAAGYFYSRVAAILDDESTEGRDVMPISEKSMPAYLKAIASLQTAAAIAPTHALYQGALAELYTRLGKWSETMQSLKARLPEGAPTGRDAAEKALVHLKRAVTLEPTNPDYHLALGRLYDTDRGNPDLAAGELRKAVAAYPVNAPLRYSVAMQHLLSGRKGDALEQARALAKVDDSYILSKPELKTDMIERQTPGYLSMLAGSYLYSALEIAWRVSKDPEVVKGIAPDNPDAARVVQLFLAARRIEEKAIR